MKKLICKVTLFSFLFSLAQPVYAQNSVDELGRSLPQNNSQVQLSEKDKDIISLFQFIKKYPEVIVAVIASVAREGIIVFSISDKIIEKTKKQNLQIENTKDQYNNELYKPSTSNEEIKLLKEAEWTKHNTVMSEIRTHNEFYRNKLKFLETEKIAKENLITEIELKLSSCIDSNQAIINGKMTDAYKSLLVELNQATVTVKSYENILNRIPALIYEIEALDLKSPKLGNKELSLTEILLNEETSLLQKYSEKTHGFFGLDETKKVGWDNKIINEYLDDFFKNSYPALSSNPTAFLKKIKESSISHSNLFSYVASNEYFNQLLHERLSKYPKGTLKTIKDSSGRAFWIINDESGGLLNKNLEKAYSEYLDATKNTKIKLYEYFPELEKLDKKIITEEIMLSKLQTKQKITKFIKIGTTTIAILASLYIIYKLLNDGYEPNDSDTKATNILKVSFNNLIKSVSDDMTMDEQIGFLTALKANKELYNSIGSVFEEEDNKI